MSEMCGMQEPALTIMQIIPSVLPLFQGNHPLDCGRFTVNKLHKNEKHCTQYKKNRPKQGNKLSFINENFLK